MSVSREMIGGIKMITRTGRTYFLDGKETYINEKLLEELGRKYLTNLMDCQLPLT